MLNSNAPNRSFGLAVAVSLALSVLVVAVALTQAVERAQLYV